MRLFTNNSMQSITIIQEQWCFIIHPSIQTWTECPQPKPPCIPWAMVFGQSFIHYTLTECPKTSTTSRNTHPVLFRMYLNNIYLKWVVYKSNKTCLQLSVLVRTFVVVVYVLRPIFIRWKSAKKFNPKWYYSIDVTTTMYGTIYESIFPLYHNGAPKRFSPFNPLAT